MSELLALARQPHAAEAPFRLAAPNVTDCHLAAAGRDTRGSAVAALGVRRVVRHGPPRATATPSPRASRHDAPAVRYVIDALPPDAPSLLDLHLRGARGIRHTLAVDAASRAAQLAVISRDADAIAPFGWHIELAVGADLAVLAGCEWELLQLPVALCLADVTDAVTRLGVRDDSVAMLLDLLHMGRTYIQLDGELRYAELRGFVNAALAVRADRLTWGSGAPAPHARPADHARVVAARLAVLERLIPDEDDRAAVLVENPARLYGFEG